MLDNSSPSNGSIVAQFKQALKGKEYSGTESAWLPWIVWGLGAAFFFAEYFARVAPSVMVTDLMRDFQVQAFALGSLSAFFYYAYVGMQIPVGMLVDRFGVHRLLTLTALICAIGSILFATANHIWVADLGRFLTGFGAAFAFVGSLKLATIWFSPTRFGLLAGLTQALGMLGAAVGEGPMSFLVSAIGWRQTMWWIAGVFLLLALLIGLIVRDFPSGYPAHEARIEKGAPIMMSLRVVLRNSQSWLNALYVGLVYAPTAAFAELWGVNYLRTAYDIGIHEAATAISCIFIGWGVGGPLVGWLSDRMGRRKPILIASALLGCVLLATVLYYPLPKSLLFLFLFLYGISNTGVAISYAVASEINPRPVAGTSIAFANMASVIVGAAFQPLIGLFLDMRWDGTKVDNVPVYSLQDYHLAMLALPICLIVSLFIAFTVRETYCRPFKAQ